MSYLDDPVEKVIGLALNKAGIEWIRDIDSPVHLDFHIPDVDVHIEAKRFYTSRSDDQLQRAENIILVQGMASAEFLASLLNDRAELKKLRAEITNTSASD